MEGTVWKGHSVTQKKKKTDASFLHIQKPFTSIRVRVGVKSWAEVGVKVRVSKFLRHHVHHVPMFFLFCNQLRIQFIRQNL